MRRRIVAALAVGAVIITGLPAAADTPPPSDPVPLMPGVGYLDPTEPASAIVAGDAVYALGTDPTGYPYCDSTLFTRSLTQDATTLDLGRSTRVARASGFTLAADGGTLAYLRRVDGRLVLRAPDGTETLPAWGNSEAIVGNGPAALTPTWLAAGSVVYDRSDGTAYDLATISSIPAGAIYGEGTWKVALAESRAVWTVTGVDEEYTAGFGAAWTVALGASGPEGPVVPLGSFSIPGGGVWIDPIGVVGDRLVWATTAGTYSPYLWTTTVSSVPVATPAAPPAQREFPDLATVHSDGTELAVAQSNARLVTWLDPADLDTDLRTFTGDPDIGIMSVWGDMVFTSNFSGWEVDASFVTDVAGRTVTADDSLPVPAATFPDVAPANPFVADISWLTDLGITRGYADGTFRPAGTVSREAMAAFLYRFAGEPTFTAPATSPFLDVATTHPFYKEISWLADTGISTGTITPAGAYYKPGDSVSRGAMAAFLYRFAGEPDWGTPETPPFVDVAPSHPFYEAISWMSMARISTGTITPAGAYYKPTDPVSRQAMAAFLHRMHTGGHTISWNTPN